MQISFLKIMQIYKKTFFLIYCFSLLTYIFYGRGLKGRAGCTKTHQGAGKANSGAYYIPVLTHDAASIARPTALLPLCQCNYGRGLVIYA